VGKNGKEQVTIPAEANTLVYADGPRLRGGTLYSSYSPCVQCAKLIAAAGIRCVVYAEESDSEALELFRLFGIETRRMTDVSPNGVGGGIRPIRGVQ
jgi:deoxycytidylate deaminase